MWVENRSDELWLEEKFQSNSDIAGSPRNSFRASLVMERRGRALNGLGVLPDYQPQPNSECR